MNSPYPLGPSGKLSSKWLRIARGTSERLVSALRIPAAITSARQETDRQNEYWCLEHASDFLGEWEV